MKAFQYRAHLLVLERVPALYEVPCHGIAYLLVLHSVPALYEVPCHGIAYLLVLHCVPALYEVPCHVPGCRALHVQAVVVPRHARRQVSAAKAKKYIVYKRVELAKKRS